MSISINGRAVAGLALTLGLGLVTACGSDEPARVTRTTTTEETTAVPPPPPAATTTTTTTERTQQ
jgi:hypothetical protein